MIGIIKIKIKPSPFTTVFFGNHAIVSVIVFRLRDVFRHISINMFFSFISRFPFSELIYYTSVDDRRY